MTLRIQVNFSHIHLVSGRARTCPHTKSQALNHSTWSSPTKQWLLSDAAIFFLLSSSLGLWEHRRRGASNVTCAICTPWPLVSQRVLSVPSLPWNLEGSPIPPMTTRKRSLPSLSPKALYACLQYSSVNIFISLLWNVSVNYFFAGR